MILIITPFLSKELKVIKKHFFAILKVPIFNNSNKDLTFLTHWNIKFVSLILNQEFHPFSHKRRKPPK